MERSGWENRDGGERDEGICRDQERHGQTECYVSIWRVVLLVTYFSASLL